MSTFLPCRAEIKASTVPSPPSAIGTWIQIASGMTFLMPRCIAKQACSAVILSLNESGANTKVFSIGLLFFIFSEI